jgi:ATP-binding cassette subfamily B protein
MKEGDKRVRAVDIYRSYMKEAKKYPFLMAGVFIATTITQVSLVMIPVYLSRFFNHLISFATEGGVEETILYSTLWVIAGLYLLQWASRRFFGFTIMPFEIKVMRDLYASSFGYLVRHSHHFFSSQFSGTLTRRVSKYVFAFEALFDSISMTFFPSFLYLVGAVTVLSIYNTTLALILAGWAVVFLTFQVVLSLWRQPLRVARSEADSAIVGGIADVIGNQHTVMLFASAKHEEKRFGSLVEKWRSAITRSWYADEYIWAVQGLLTVGIQLGLLYGAFYFWRLGKLTIGDFVLIQTYAIGIVENLVGVTRELRRVYDAVADASEMVGILNQPHSIVDAPHARDLKVQGGALSMQHVTFSYGDSRESVLKDFSIDIKAGEKVGVVGKSGAGKSTLVKLLLRHYDITQGSIVIDGQDIRSVTQDSLREHIAFVPQESMLFHRSLRENIAYGNIAASDQEIYEASQKAYAHDFIERLPKKYETYVGERGVKLSGGERQRVAIARAILKDAPILILDEATASLDSESEVAIQNALHKLMEGKTVLAIAHRLSTLREMDRIIVLDQGQIVEDGTHDELVARGGIYSELWSHQAGGFIPDDE